MMIMIMMMIRSTSHCIIIANYHIAGMKESKTSVSIDCGVAS